MSTKFDAGVGKPVVSVDWDFFIYNGEFETEYPIAIDGEPSTTHGALVFDWGHSEGHGAALGRLLWGQRVGMFRRYGLELETEHSIEKAGLTPDEFLATLDRYVDLSGAMSFQADSHANAIRVVNTFAPCRVLSFDAHHDLAYGQGAADAADEGRCDAGSWLYAGLAEGWVMSATIVYPDWRRHEEAPFDENGELHPWLKRFEDRIEFLTWSEWKARTPLPRTPAGRTFPAASFICRSSAWTPPYLDEEFARFAVNLADGDPICLDCDAIADEELTPVGAYNVCDQRGWDREAIEENLRIQEEQLAELYRIQKEATA